ncbi:hypothetical protein SAMN05444280_11781 [Tangfeifania diversioriginum]|uniref:Uncharacterized protein n=2 Tax=Tangfeifania diversioriginum TaxID=1168035 RepID=A0A1M6IQ64_9BACT|nr:hypothetical protein SAMN05444280_11781 [Tangfeifania diversioriginum]
MSLLLLDKLPPMSKLEIHYHFDNLDSTHTMDAFIRNRCEFELLQISHEFQKKLDLDIKIETEAFEEGGLTEFWTFLSDNAVQIALILTLLSQVLSRVPLRKSRLSKKELELSVAEKELSILQLKKQIQESEKPDIDIQDLNIFIDTNPKILKHISNFYNQLDKYLKVKELSTTILDDKKSKVNETAIVKREDFKKFILESDELEPIVDEDATIEIISPVLKRGKYKWKGIYNKVGHPIEFFMKDKDFKGTVIAEGVAFKNGTFIDCILEISRKINEIGEIFDSSYSVLTVLKKHDENVSEETPQGKKYRKEKEAEKAQMKLFDENDKNE